MKSKTNNYDLAILIPAFAEAKRLGKTLDALAKYLKTHDMGRVIVTVVSARKTGDDSDAVSKLVSSRSKNFSKLEHLDAGHHPGGLKGRDVQIGMKHLHAKYEMFMDADLATPLHHLETMMQQFHQGAEIVIGERDLSKIHNSLLRQFISVVGNLVVRILLRIHYTDTQCGFKGFTSAASNDLFGVQTILGWGFDMEILAVAHKRKYRVAQISIYDWHDVTGGTFDESAVADSLHPKRYPDYSLESLARPL